MPSSTSRPSPRSAPAHSPNTAPITETVAATRSPLKRRGSDEGSSTFQSVAAREAPMLRMSLRSCSSTDRRPSTTFTVTGKKQMSATIAILGPIP